MLLINPKSFKSSTHIGVKYHNSMGHQVRLEVDDLSTGYI
jgi:hypothetical protein